MEGGNLLSARCTFLFDASRSNVLKRLTRSPRMDESMSDEFGEILS